MSARSFLLLTALLSGIAAPAFAGTVTGTFSTDEDVVSIPVTLTHADAVTIYSTSYGGGLNLDGTVSAPGGFEPLLTLYSPTGAFLDSAGGDQTCVAGINADPGTGTCGDAVLHFASLAAGTYTLAVTENINYPNGNLADGFSETGFGNFTGTICGSTGGFLQSDLAGGACVQRSAAFTVNVAVPEPADLAVLFVGFAALAVAGATRRRI
jgi:hypothetical protein